VLALTDAMTKSVDVPDDVFASVRAFADDKTIVEIIATVAAYNMVSRFLVALRIAH
jgi:4-carboxymuconolactone decarboxylase